MTMAGMKRRNPKPYRGWQHRSPMWGRAVVGVISIAALFESGEIAGDGYWIAAAALAIPAIAGAYAAIFFPELIDG